MPIKLIPETRRSFGSKKMSHLKDITGSEGRELSGKKIALCVTASVSITEAPRIARILMRHGADVIAVLTREAQELVSPMIFEWSTGNAPIAKITGRVEHVELVSSKEGRVDAIVIAPCTANALSKIASGISDDPVSTLVSTALGTDIPLLIALAMHEPMLKNPIILDSISKLEKIGVKFVKGRLEEGKSKIATPEEILEALIDLLNKDKESSLDSAGRDLGSLGFLITAGPTRESIDDVRFISNASSGKMGIALAKACVARNAANVCLIVGPGVVVTDELAQGIKIRKIVSTEDLLDCVLDELASGRYKVFISAGAPADYAPISIKGKISTEREENLSLKLTATKKVIKVAKEKYPKTLVVSFKAEVGMSESELIRRARESLEKSGADAAVANDVGRNDIGFGSEENEVIILPRDEAKEPRVLRKESKREIAHKILDYIMESVS